MKRIGISLAVLLLSACSTTSAASGKATAAPAAASTAATTAASTTAAATTAATTAASTAGAAAAAPGTAAAAPTAEKASGVESNEDQFKALAASTSNKPFVMLNLIKFKEGGQESYAKYLKAAGPFGRAVGAKTLYFGKANELLQGKEKWDAVLLVQYPSRKAFLKMISDPKYLKVHELRKDGLDRAVLYVTDPQVAKTK